MMFFVYTNGKLGLYLHVVLMQQQMYVKEVN